MVTRPEDIYPALSGAYNAGDLDALVSLYDPKAVFVIKPGRVTESPAELRGAMQHGSSGPDFRRVVSFGMRGGWLLASRAICPNGLRAATPEMSHRATCASLSGGRLRF